MDCILCKIVAGELPSQKVHEDELTLAIRDIRPQAPTHVLVVPRVHIAEPVDPALAGRLLSVAAEVARREKLEKGWRLIVNTGEHGGQELQHLHLHVIGGRKLGRMLPPA